MTSVALSSIGGGLGFEVGGASLRRKCPRKSTKRTRGFPLPLHPAVCVFSLPRPVFAIKAGKVSLTRLDAAFAVDLFKYFQAFLEAFRSFLAVPQPFVDNAQVAKTVGHTAFVADLFVEFETFLEMFGRFLVVFLSFVHDAQAVSYTHLRAHET
jgi:hypothetical protein